jgi:flagellar hook-length control protein FliK
VSGIDPVAAIKPASGSRGEAQRLLAQLEPGQILSARVGARLPDGNFRVEVAGQELRMALPAYVAAGDTLELSFITYEPRPTFALQERLAQAQSAPVLSAAGRLVAAMMPQPGEPAVLAAATAGAPLLAALPADGVGLSAALEHTLAQSGLFYEAHQAEWVAGRHDLAQLRSEPQARFGLVAPQLPVLPTEDTAAAGPTATDSAGAAAAPRSEQLMRPEGSTLVQQQLAALESGKIVLQLEVWPKQWMQWEIEEREERAQDAAREADAPSSWHTRLRLDLPQLGELNAALTLSSNGVQIKLDAAKAASATLLDGHLASLHAALAAAGVPAAGIAIGFHEQP